MAPFTWNKVKPGDPISAGHFQQVLDEVHRQSRITVAAPLEIKKGPMGTHISLGGVKGGAATKTAVSYLSSYPDVKSWSQSTSQRNIWGFKLVKDDYTFAEDGSQTIYTPNVDTETEVVYAFNLKGTYYVPQGKRIILSKANGRYVFEYVNTPVRGTLKAKLIGTGPVEISVVNGAGELGDLMVYMPHGSKSYYYPTGSIVTAFPMQVGGAIRYEVVAINSCPVNETEGGS
jgi:hypothetical protein